MGPAVAVRGSLVATLLEATLLAAVYSIQVTIPSTNYIATAGDADYVAADVADDFQNACNILSSPEAHTDKMTKSVLNFVLQAWE